MKFFDAESDGQLLPGQLQAMRAMRIARTAVGGGASLLDDDDDAAAADGNEVFYDSQESASVSTAATTKVRSGCFDAIVKWTLCQEGEITEVSGWVDTAVPGEVLMENCPW